MIIYDFVFQMSVDVDDAITETGDMKAAPSVWNVHVEAD